MNRREKIARGESGVSIPARFVSGLAGRAREFSGELPDEPVAGFDPHLGGVVNIRFVGERQLLLVLDNCEHLLDSSAELILALLGTCPDLTLLTTSREPIGLAGEVTWRVPSLSLTDEAVSCSKTARVG